EAGPGRRLRRRRRGLRGTAGGGATEEAAFQIQDRLEALQGRQEDVPSLIAAAAFYRDRVGVPGALGEVRLRDLECLQNPGPPVGLDAELSPNAPKAEMDAVGPEEIAGHAQIPPAGE